MKVLLTGSSGYVGGVLADYFTRRNWMVVSPQDNAGRAWRLPADVGESCFQNVDALVHCAWDMRPSSPVQAEKTNVQGSQKLLSQARHAGIKHLVFISSMSAYDGCESAYGRMKLFLEQEFLLARGVVIRPGLVYGKKAGGMVGKLQTLVRKLPVIPLPCASAKQYLIDEETLAETVFQAACGQASSGVYSVAHSTPRSMAQIVKTLAATVGSRAPVIPVPWQPAFWALSLLQKTGLRLPVTADNLLGLARANAQPDFSSFHHLPIQPKLFPDGLSG